MSNYVIITDSTSDLPQKIVEEMDIKVIPMSFEIGGKSYLNYPDGRELDPHEFYEMLRRGKTAVTSLINTTSFMECFEPFVKEGYDILYVAFSSALSGTYNSSLIAADMLNEKYKGSKIICVDSKAASMGEGLLVYTAAKLKERGMGLEELYKWIMDNRLKLCHWVTVNDLNHLKRGGRINPLTATIGTALNVKPILHVDDEGCLVPAGSVRGRKKSLHTLIEHMKETITNPEEQVIFIGHGDSLEEALYLAEIAKKDVKVKDVVTGYIGPVIGSHSGPGIMTVHFFGTKR
ncbi:MAG: DegV family protein [Clostridiaceae bacterium]